MKRVTPNAASREARDLRWLLDRLVAEVPGARSVVVVSSDGLLLLASDAALEEPVVSDQDRWRDRSLGRPSANLATIVSGLGSLTSGAAELSDGGAVRQTMIAMARGLLFLMPVSDGSLIAVHTDRDCDMSVVTYHMALLVGRAGHVLTPELRSELRQSMDSAP